MSDALTLRGSFLSTPKNGNPSGDDSLGGVIDESVSVDQLVLYKGTLVSDGPLAMPLGGLASVRVLKVKVTGGPVTLLLTSVAGDAQAVPCGSLSILFSDSDPFTAIALQRKSGTTTQVRVLMGG